MKLSLKLFGNTLLLRSYKQPKLDVKGYTSRTEEGLHVLFLDYDGVNPEIMYYDLEQLSDMCSHFFIFTSAEEKDELGTVGNYHVVCCDKFFFSEIIDMQQVTHSDTAHKNMVKYTRYRAWVLRLFGKGKRPAPRFKQLIVTDTKPLRGHSDAHLKLMSLLSKKASNEIKKNGSMWEGDGRTKLKVTHYTTAYEKKS